ARAQTRERRYRAPMIRAKDWLQNAVAGRPSEPNPPPPELATSSSLADSFEPLDDGGLYDSPAAMAHYRDRGPAATDSAGASADGRAPGATDSAGASADGRAPAATDSAPPRWRGE